MPDRRIRDGTAGAGRIGIAAAWIAALCCLPYLILKVVWTLDIPIGVTDRSVLHGSGWVVANALMALVQLAGLLLVLTLIRPWAQRLPAWLLLFPAWVGTGLLFQIAVGAALAPALSAASHTSTDTGGIQSWVFVMVYASFAAQGAALAIAFAYYVRDRWGPLLRTRTGDVMTRRTVRLRSWPENHLTQLALAEAGLTFAVALLCGYWAAGGSFGPSGLQPDPPPALQAARLAGAVTATVGLLALAGRWGRHYKLWLPVTLTWIGSGAVVAFDGLSSLLFLTLPPDSAQAGWSLTDTLVLIKVAVGLVAAAVAILVITAVAKDKAASSAQRTRTRSPADR